jgi:hypothetical protein
MLEQNPYTPNSARLITWRTSYDLKSWDSIVPSEGGKLKNLQTFSERDENLKHTLWKSDLLCLGMTFVGSAAGWAMGGTLGAVLCLMGGVVFFALQHNGTNNQITLGNVLPEVRKPPLEVEKLTAEYHLIGSTQKSFTGTLSIQAGSTGAYSTDVPFPPAYFRVFDVWNVVVRRVDEEVLVGGIRLRIDFPPEPRPQFRIHVITNQECSNKTLTIKGWS